MDEGTVAALEGFGARYAALLGSASAAAGLLELGRELYGFLEGDGGDLTKLLEEAPRPLHFEIVAASRRPDGAALALLRSSAAAFPSAGAK